MADIDPIMQGHLDHVVNSLVNETRGGTDRDTIREVVYEAYDEIAADAKFEQFIPILTMRQARLLLQMRDRMANPRENEPETVLIVCGTNAGRSQVAAALLRFYAPGLLEVVSAGQNPREGINEDAVAYMRDHGVELTDYPKRLRPEYIGLADHIIFAGSNSADVPTEKDTERWPIPHTTGLDRAALEDAVQMIDDRVRAFIARVLPDAEIPASIFEVRA
jgi:arsenate reductase